METFQTQDPYSGESIETHKHLSKTEAEGLIGDAQKSFLIWKNQPLVVRAGVLKSIAGLLRKNVRPLTQMMAREMGKPLPQGREEVEKCAVACEYFAEQGPDFLKIQTVPGPYQKNEIHLEPVGVILAIMPWNFPLWQVIRFAAPALLAGNTIVLKHADLTAGTSRDFVSLLKNIFSSQLVFNAPMTHETCAQVMALPEVRGVTFTGSTAGGRKIAEMAGKNLKKTVLELGGSDAYVILADADLEKAASVCAKARMVNSGQSCVAAKRFIVEASVMDSFVGLFTEAMGKFTFGNPLQLSTEMGPLASKKFQATVSEQVQKLKKLGGKIILGGEVPDGPGAFYPPTILVFEKNTPELGNEEIFGPVAILIQAQNSEQALQIANASIYGLGGAIFSKDEAKAQAMARQMESGIVVINDQVKSDARLPFGGVKNSGYGRELSIYGLREFCNVKSVGINS